MTDTWDNADEWGFAPDTTCDNCGGKLYQQPIVDEDRRGWCKVFCSRDCCDEFWQAREKDE